MTVSAALIPQRVGEVIEANSAAFTAQCYQLYAAPPLGSLVKAGTPETLGVVCRVSTEPLDPSRPALARGEHAATEEELYRDNPQLSRLLTTRFEALLVGFRAGSELRQGLPPLPPRVHSFVFLLAPLEAAAFAAKLDFLRLALQSGQPAAEEVAAACLRQLADGSLDPAAFRLRAGKALAAELAQDLPRLNAILRRLAP